MGSGSEVRQRLSRLWRFYTRMRTAIMFLIVVGLLVLIGSFVPQQNTSDQTKVDQFIAANPAIISLFSHLGLTLTQVFVSPVFFVTAALLYGSLGACVIRRLRKLIFRAARGYRGYQFWGEAGSWTFHAAFFVLLFAVLWGKLTGFQGLVEVTEGSAFTEARAGYDQLQEGMLFNGQHSGFQMHLDKFTATYQPDGVAADYVSHVTVVEHGKVVAQHDIRVNDPLDYNGVSIYQQDYGWAPHLVVKNPQGQVVFDDYIQFLPGAPKSVGVGVLKAPDFGLKVPGSNQTLQLGADLSVFPDAHVSQQVNPDGTINTDATQYIPGGQEARFPVLQMKFYIGDLGLGRGPQNVNTLDTSTMTTLTKTGDPVPLPMGQTDTLPILVNGQPQYFSVSFPDIRQFSLFLVKRDDGVPLIYLSFVMIMFGLLTKLYLVPFLKSRTQKSKVDESAAQLVA